VKSRLFHSTDYKTVQNRVRDLVNGSPDFLSKNTAQSPRAAGDAIESVVAASFDKILGDHCGEYSSNFARRAMADLAFNPDCPLGMNHQVALVALMDTIRATP
jgi:hypothetical protein